MKFPKLSIRDSHSVINGQDERFTMPSGGMEIIAEDGRTLFNVRLLEGGILDISAGSFCKHEDVLLDDRLIIRPASSNRITLRRPSYEEENGSAR